jgi:replication factor C small subunit
MKELWVDKYRPTTLDQYVFKDEHQKNTIMSWVKDGTIPHILLSGSPGIGKTTLALVLMKELGIPDFDVLEVNASRETGIDFIRDRIEPHVQRIPFGPFKVVLLDEADRLSQQAQDSLKGMIEEYSAHARFVLTCNSPNRILPPLHSRLQQMHFGSVDQTEFTARAATILVEEGIEFDLDTLDTYVKVTYPDLRKCTNFLQQHCIDGKLTSASSADSGVADYKIQMVDLFKKGKITEARKLLCGRARPDEMEDIFRWLYDNVALFGDVAQQDKAIMIIKQGLVDHSVIIDPEINLSATLIRLSHLNG